MRKYLRPRVIQAKAATLTIAQGFSLAYQAWQDRQVKTKNENVIKKKESPMSNVIVTEAIVENVPQPGLCMASLLFTKYISSVKRSKS